MIRAILFDLNKVLVALKNIDGDYQRAFGISQEEFWSPRKEFLDDYVTGKISLDEFLLKIMDRNGVSNDKLSEAKDLHVKNLDLIPGMKELLSSLRESYSVFLVAGDGKESLDMKLKKFGLESCFDKIYVSSDVGVVKTDVNYYRHILRDSGLSAEETLFIDDQESYLEKARELGINTILFEGLEKLKKDLEDIGVKM